MKPMSRITIIISQFAFVLAVVYGLYIVIHGHLTPGGGFQGGAILASAVAMVLVAFGEKDIKSLLPQKLDVVYVALGVFMFLSIAFLIIIPEGAKIEGSVFASIYNAFAGPGGLFGYQTPIGPNDGYLNTGGIVSVKSVITGLEVIAALYIILKVMFWAENDVLSKDESGLMNSGGDHNA